jgi:Calcium binding
VHRPPRAISPLRKGQEVQVVGLAPADECEREMFVTITWEDPTLALPLAQLEADPPDKVTGQAVADWHYWVNQGYQF